MSLLPCFSLVLNFLLCLQRQIPYQFEGFLLILLAELLEIAVFILACRQLALNQLGQLLLVFLPLLGSLKNKFHQRWYIFFQGGRNLRQYVFSQFFLFFHLLFQKLCLFLYYIYEQVFFFLSLSNFRLNVHRQLLSQFFQLLQLQISLVLEHYICLLSFF